MNFGQGFRVGSVLDSLSQHLCFAKNPRIGVLLHGIKTEINALFFGNDLPTAQDIAAETRESFVEIENGFILRKSGSDKDPVDFLSACRVLMRSEQ